uniref:Schlafen AlbA-2 domain-containing protein n=1 Tax=Candidatus Methanogaster sp. ANME-2c ERB4 TaxID=2759911 RepID=A0A7G9Y942_9EURY|nr:hypothetical protein JFDIJABK_00007 [Methanosarcinales archaeon ANME-2c ERB4]QNO44914.1 hypothetical protein ICHINCKE_00016 [Methanosarcinales archaeon ANME-2c ERB4]QNO46258.1 hypothetical protein HPELKGOP_00016 [Methanosarcinales archaeon ANME-2c ERB4]
MDLRLDEGEGYLIEFKESMSDSLAKEMVACTNSSGERIFLGVSDEGMEKGSTSPTDLDLRFRTLHANATRR